MSDIEAVLFANETFYHAFSNHNFEAMEALWSDGSPVSCIHPGWNPQHGRDQVMKTWETILNDQAPAIRCAGEKVYLLGTCAAVVTCFEIVGQTVLASTNIFVREDGHWRITHHQAGPSTLPPPEHQTPDSTALH